MPPNPQCFLEPRQAKGELRAAQTEIIALKEDKDALGRSLQAKAKEVRTQVLQVHLLYHVRTLCSSKFN